MNPYINQKKTIMHINMLGDFSIQSDKYTICDRDNQSKKTWIVLEYLIAFRKRYITADELINLIWPDDKSKNPQGALKTLIFRSRQLLTPLNYSPNKIIIQKDGSYEWNKSIETIVDVDIFEDLATKILSLKPELRTPDETLDSCLKALDIYKGKFLYKARYENWVIPISAYYHSLFQQVLYKAFEILIQQENFDTIIFLCERAITIERFDEEIHYNLIYALYQNGDQKKALEHYTRTTDMFYNEFAKTPSEHFKNLYKTIQNTNNGVITDLSIIIDRLQEESTYLGAYCCEYSVFKEIYQLTCRSTERNSSPIFLCMISISDAHGELLKSNIQVTAMNELGNAIRYSLRKGDVYSRFSISQYIFLLPTDTKDSADTVLKRIIKHFKNEYKRKDLSIYYSIMSLLQSRLES